jgi:ribulose-phosphate 3-epimerase
MKIIPAILPASYRAIEQGVTSVRGAVDTVQIDFVDGTFAPNRTWWFNNKDTERLSAILREEEGLPEWEHMNYEFDVMLANPLEHMETFIALGPSKIIFHVEGLDEGAMLAYFTTIPEIVRTTISFGMALGIETDPAIIAPYLPYITTIQCMGILRVGFQGQPFDERVHDQIKKVRALYPDMIISVDGGVTMENAVELIHSGATELVVGSQVFGNIDPRGTIKKLITLCRKATASEN